MQRDIYAEIPESEEEDQNFRGFRDERDNLSHRNSIQPESGSEANSEVLSPRNNWDQHNLQRDR